MTTMPNPPPRKHRASDEQLSAASRERHDQIASTAEGIASDIAKWNERFGFLDYDGADIVLATVFGQKGYHLLGVATPVQLDDDEVEIALAFDDGSGPKTAVMALTSRLRGNDVVELAERIQSPSWATALREAGFIPPWVPYIYARRLYADAWRAIEPSGFGLLFPEGERIAPTRIVW